MSTGFDPRTHQISRRSLMKTAAVAGGSVLLSMPALPEVTVAAQDSGEIKEVPREKCLIHGITGNQLTDYNLFNPFLPGIATSSGYPYCFEPLYYYNAYATDAVCGPEDLDCENGFIPWLATGYEFNDDFTELTFTLRDGAYWNDGEPFTANDVVFTIKMLQEHAPTMTWSIDMRDRVADVTAPDDLTVVLTLSEPNPRFMFNFFAFHFDIGIPIVPAHIWEGENPEEYTFIDIANGIPVTTSPWKVVLSSPEQRIYDRADSYWAADAGLVEMPAMERIIVLPGTDETKMVQMAINNEVDLTIDLRPNNIIAVTQQNPNITTWTGNEPPYGYRDWWPIGLGFNCMKEPFDNPDIRWAINHAIDRDQLVQFGYQGAGEKTLLPIPGFPALNEYVDSIPELTGRIDSFDRAKTDELMTAQGWEKDGDGFWAKDGERFPFIIFSLILFQDIAPILVEQLRQAGYDASFRTVVGPEFSDSVYTGNVDAYIFGHGGSIRDPYSTMNLYHSRYSLPTGERATYPYRWVNEKYDGIVDEMALTSPDDPKLMDLFKQGMELWVDALPDIGLVQWFHRIPTNQTYWTNFPSEDNPYINSAYWHRTAPLWINSLKAAGE